KRINDTYGHSAGDAVLRELGQLSQALAEPHKVYRVGGEEFAILVAAEAGTCVSLSESLRSAVEAHGFTHDQRAIAVTVSLGYAEMVSDDSAQQLYQRADKNLYASKNGGRNRTTGP
ncbi:MAG TPA: GGDEF domain-containing protein, partial [Polyangiaceae bacterium]|nr:GGDEF domain-containing protein [Polyangiaceae bacterium]